jgi:hypothetical protein
MKTTMNRCFTIAMAFVTMTASQAAETDAARHVAGLPGVKPRAVGKLMATDKGIAFEEGGATTSVDSAQIVKVSTDDELYLRGGWFGQFIRTGIPFAGGLGIGLSGLSQSLGIVPFGFGVLATAFMRSHSDVITFEYFDPHDGYHGAVFMMPWHAAEEMKRQVAASGVAPTVDQPKNQCPAITTYPHSITMLPVSSHGAEIPDEYRVLTYEHVFHALQRKADGWQIRRLGAPNDLADCDELKLAITVEAFHKGNAAERALIGPLRQFIGTTNLSCRVVLSNGHGESLLDEKVKAAIHGDRESLDLGYEISRLISRKVRKAVPQSWRISPI